jgi:hypothetical protein
MSPPKALRMGAFSVSRGWVGCGDAGGVAAAGDVAVPHWGQKRQEAVTGAAQAEQTVFMFMEGPSSEEESIAPFLRERM